MGNANVQSNNIESTNMDASNSKGAGKASANETMKINRYFLSLMKERIWLEEMAQKGYKLIGMTMGIRYTFEKIKPTTLAYSIERFDIPSSPSLNDIQAKNNFLELCDEMGWECVTHDEDLNYYFCKECTDGIIEELYDTEDSRKLHAEKFRKRYNNMGRVTLKSAFIGPICLLLLSALYGWSFHDIKAGYMYFCLIYLLGCISLTLIYDLWGNYFYKELSLSKEEWIARYDYNSANTKKVRKMFFRSKTLVHFLEEQSQQGWQLTKAGILSYGFTRDDHAIYQYTIDSKHLTNNRMAKRGLSTIHDSKDLNGISHDWQAQSVHDFTCNGWEFACAYKNNIVIYRTLLSNTAQQCNTSLPIVGIFSLKFSIYLTCCFMLGAACGFLWAMLT